MKTHRSSPKAAGALAVATAIAFTASTAPSQVVDKPDANLSVVQAEEGPGVPYDGRVEVQLAPRAQRALAEGGGWEALVRGLELRYEGERPVESEVRVALVTRDGRVLDSQVLDSVKLERGDSPLRAKQIVFSQAEDRVPVAAYAGEKHKPRGPGVFDENARIPVPNITRADERGVMPGDNVMERTKPHLGQGETEVRRDQMLVITVVPTDPDARGQIEVQPLFVDLEAKGQTGNPLLAPDDDQDPGPAFPLDQPIEVQLPASAERALADGAGWQALEGVRFLYDGEEPIEATVHYAVVERNGEVLESRSSNRVKLGSGHSRVGAAKELDFMRKAIQGTGFRTVPTAAFSPSDTYIPDPDNWAAGHELLPSRDWDARHTVTDPDNMVRKQTIPTPERDTVEDEAGERAIKPDRGGKDIKPDRGGKDIFLVITVVPTDPEARERVEVRPLIVDLDAK